MKSMNSKAAYVPPVWPTIEFSLFVIGEILSIPCYLLVMYHILMNKTARKALSNHSIIVLLVYDFLQLTLDLPMIMSYTRLGFVSPFSPALCFLWRYVDHGIWYGGLFLMFWTSVERHILVFHFNLIRTARNRFIFHYLPLLFFSLYAPIFYFYFVFLYPCRNVLVSTIIQCGQMCFEKLVPGWFFLYVYFVHYVAPILLIAAFSITLILRFINQKRRLQQATTWRQCRRMVTQLIFTSAVYLIFDLPQAIIHVVQWFGSADFGHEFAYPYIARLTYVPAILLPYAILLTLPQLRQKLHALFLWKNKRQVATTTNY